VVPFLVADLRLADRFSLGPGGKPLAEQRGLGDFAREVLGGLGGGSGPALAIVALLALGGFALLARDAHPFSAFAAGLLVTTALVPAFARAGDPAPLSSRYVIFLLPVWAALVGVAVSRLPLAAVSAAAVGALVFLAPGNAITDPRVLPAAEPDRLAAPADWVRARVGEHDVLFPYSPVYLSALPESARATVVSRARPELLLRELAHAELPVRRVFVAVPKEGSWQLRVAEGPFQDRAAILRALQRELASLEPDPYVLKARTAVAAALAAS
jgi:hypothetical protein